MSACNLGHGHGQMPALASARDARRAKQAGPCTKTPAARKFEQKMALSQQKQGLLAIDFIALEAGAVT